MRYTLEILFKDRKYSHVYFSTTEKMLVYLRINEDKILNWKMHYFGA